MSVRTAFSLLFASTLLLGLSQCAAFRPATTTTAPGADTTPTGLRMNIIQFAQQQIGAGYRYGGRDPQRGFDCSGFTQYVLGRYDVNVTPQSGVQAQSGRSLPLKSAQPGDLVYFKRSSLGPVFHVALVVSNDTNGLVVVHSTTSRGVIQTNITQSSYWRPKAAGARDVIGR